MTEHLLNIQYLEKAREAFTEQEVQKTENPCDNEQIDPQKMLPRRDGCIKEVTVQVRKAVSVEATLREALLTTKIHKWNVCRFTPEPPDRTEPSAL